jgi:hypothetical protein
MSKYWRSRILDRHLSRTYSDERNSGRVENKQSNAIKGAYPTSPPIKEPEKADEEEAQVLKMVAIFVVVAISIRTE